MTDEKPPCLARGHRAADVERMKRWREANPWRYREHKQREYAKRRKVPVERVDPFAVHERDGGLCFHCGAAVPLNDRSFSLAYVVPLPRGGGHVFNNVRAAHLLCRHAVRSRLPLPNLSPH